MISVIELFGGVGLFLFGMSLMGSSLKKLAGGGLEKILQNLTTSKKRGVGEIKGWGLGLIITGIIQSSAATTIMLIGFVNAGIMTLAQTIPVVYGSNIGSTFTAQILRLGDLGSGSLILQLLKPSSFAPMLLVIGTTMHMFSKKPKLKDLAGIFVGLGTLFYGMTMMEEVFKPLQQSDTFKNFFLSFNNPFIGILTGLVLTAVIQSSSASVGILQALSATGSITYGMAVPIIIGQNIGKCMTIVLGSVGANKKAKRVALSYLLFNIIGALFFTIVIYSIYYTVGIPFFSKVVNRGDIANIHLGFNLIISLILLPFPSKMAKLTEKIIKDKPVENEDMMAKELAKLDDMLLKTPGIALTQCKNLMQKMGDKIQENYKIAIGLLTNFDSNAFDTLNKNEDFIDKCETALSTYIVKIDRDRLTIDNRNVIFAMLNTIGDYERIGDYCINIAYIAEECNNDKVVFSEVGLKEITGIAEATGHIIELVFNAVESENMSKAYMVQPLARAIDDMKELIESHHVDRLQTGDCGVKGGVALYDLTSFFQRIALHSKVISKHLIKRLSRDNDIDAQHGQLVDKSSEEYIALEQFFFTKYIEPIVGKKTVPAEEEIKGASTEDVKKDKMTEKKAEKKDTKSGSKTDKNSEKKHDKGHDKNTDKKKEDMSDKHSKGAKKTK